ncbi:carboxypeptidase [Virgibacillus profundi]|uniref:Carboxypeptidase n=1 Tax=Virgibacillus profundi TaxID=2024555 RepID=A0A2A2IEX3_9BACI|nr:D-alanyl-D-alanine carboxypeptidase family protein [Virgibacillus profundi]PAV30561.1 carboxypeptidase [Virgibacillus profundi]PXY54733.1 carboxypeptidase [Virgibacillus profundi]
MFKKSITIVLALVSILIFTTACNTEDSNETDSDDTTNNEAVNETSSSESDESAEAEIQIPEAGLQKKDNGEAVQMLQKALNKIGYSFEENGDYAETTTWAITDLQLQHDLSATGVYNEDTKKTLETLVADNIDIQPGAGLPREIEVSTTDDQTQILANPFDLLALVNKQRALPGEYIPEDLVVPDVQFPFAEDLPKKQMRKVAADPMEDMFQAAENAGLELYAQSGYRSYDTQVNLFASYASQHGEEAANKFSARPGESEHQSGLTMDVTSPEVDFKLVEAFGDTDEGKWLVEHAAEYGFIIRYPKGKEEITEYQYEPWHLRFVGEKAAKDIMSNQITLEEYFEID